MTKMPKWGFAVAILLLVATAGGFLLTHGSQPIVPTSSTPVQQALNSRALEVNAAATRDMVKRNYPQAVEKFRQSLAIQPDPYTKIQLAVALLRVGERPEAIEILKGVAQGQSDAKEDAAIMLGKVERDPKWGAAKH